MQINFVYAHAYCVHVNPAYAVPVGATEGVRPSGTEVVGTGERPAWKLGLRPGSLQKQALHPLRHCFNSDWATRVLTVGAALGTLATTFTGEYTFLLVWLLCLQSLIYAWWALCLIPKLHPLHLQL